MTILMVQKSQWIWKKKIQKKEHAPLTGKVLILMIFDMQIIRWAEIEMNLLYISKFHVVVLTYAKV